MRSCKPLRCCLASSLVNYGGEKICFVLKPVSSRNGMCHGLHVSFERPFNRPFGKSKLRHCIATHRNVPLNEIAGGSTMCVSITRGCGFSFRWNAGAERAFDSLPVVLVIQCANSARFRCTFDDGVFHEAKSFHVDWLIRDDWRIEYRPILLPIAKPFPSYF